MSDGRLEVTVLRLEVVILETGSSSDDLLIRLRTSLINDKEQKVSSDEMVK
jgi:hypothetical protein